MSTKHEIYVVYRYGWECTDPRYFMGSRIFSFSGPIVMNRTFIEELVSKIKTIEGESDCEVFITSAIKLQ